MKIMIFVLEIFDELGDFGFQRPFHTLFLSFVSDLEVVESVMAALVARFFDPVVAWSTRGQK